MLLFPLIPNYIIIVSYYIFDSIKHRPAFTIDKMQQNQTLTLDYQLLENTIILIHIFLEMLFWWLSTIFN